jgi:hypothetical protein
MTAARSAAGTPSRWMQIPEPECEPLRRRSAHRDNATTAATTRAPQAAVTASSSQTWPATHPTTSATTTSTPRSASTILPLNDALSEKERRDRHALDRLKEIAAQADPDKVARMMAHVDAQAARLPRR